MLKIGAKMVKFNGFFIDFKQKCAKIVDFHVFLMIFGPFSCILDQI